MALSIKMALSLLDGIFLGLAPAQAQTLDLLKIGIPSPLNTILAFWMADEAGFYKEQGIRVEFRIVDGGGRGAQLIRSGAIDVMQAGLVDIICDDFRAGSPPTTEPTQDAIDNVIRSNGAQIVRGGRYLDSGLLRDLLNSGFFAELGRIYPL
jgi:ABC-type nitrate/sulfonate/bicarbonate transport system substrate-binding protein